MKQGQIRGGVSTESRRLAFEGVVLLRAYRWDKAEFCRQFQTDWKEVLSDENGGDPTQITFSWQGMACRVALVAGPALEQIEPYQFGAYPWEEIVRASERSTAHLVLSVDASPGVSPLEVAKVFAQIAASLLADSDNAQGLWSDEIYHDNPETYRDLALEVRESPNPDLWVGYAIAHLDEGIVCYSVGLHKFGSLEIEIVCLEEAEDAARDVMDMLIGEVVVEGNLLRDIKNISYNKGVSLSIGEAQSVVSQGQPVYRIDLPDAVKDEGSPLGIILTLLIGLGLIFYGVYLYFDLSQFEYVGGHRTLWGPAATIYKLAEGILPRSGKVLAPLLSIGIGLSFIVPALKDVGKLIDGKNEYDTY